MRKRFGVVGLTTMLAIVATLALTSGTAMGNTGHGGWQPRPTPPRPFVCRGGDFASGNLTPIPSGNYSTIIVTGACAPVPDAVINVGSIYVDSKAVLDAQSAPSTITVYGNVFAGKGSLLGLGCQSPADTGNSAHACTVEPDAHSTITVYGSVTTVGADTVLLNGNTIKGNVTLLAGGGAIPWSIKNNAIGGNLTIVGVTADWVGVLFNKIRLNATLLKIKVTDTEPVPRVFIVQNHIGLNLTCFGLEPGVSGGFVPGAVNVVGRQTFGQCRALV